MSDLSSSSSSKRSLCSVRDVPGDSLLLGAWGKNHAFLKRYKVERDLTQVTAKESLCSAALLILALLFSATRLICWKKVRENRPTIGSLTSSSSSLPRVALWSLWTIWTLMSLLERRVHLLPVGFEKGCCVDIHWLLCMSELMGTIWEKRCWVKCKLKQIMIICTSYKPIFYSQWNIVNLLSNVRKCSGKKQTKKD